MMPINYRMNAVKDCAAWRAYGRQIGLRANNWRNAAARYALANGKAIVFHCDDSATIFERDSRNKQGFARHHLPADCIYWHDGLVRLPDIFPARA